MTTVAGVARVTVVAPGTRVDLVLPENVPLAEALPTLLRCVTPRGPAEQWVLDRDCGAPLDPTRTPAQLGLRPGERLRLVRRDGESAPLYAGDLDAIVDGADHAGRAWAEAATRRCGLAALTGTALVGAGLLAGYGHGLPAGIAGLAIGVALLAAGAAAVRRLGDRTVGVLAAALGLPYGLVGAGLLADTPTGTVFACAAGIAVAAALAPVATGHRVPEFAAASIAAAAAALASLPAWLGGSRPAACAAVLVVLVLAAMPLLPAAAPRLAAVPLPLPAPADPEDAALAAGHRATRYLTALLTATAILVLACLVPIVAAGRPTGWALAAVAVALPLLRARVHRRLAHRIPLLAAGLAGVAGLLVAVAAAAGPLPGLRLGLALAGLLAVGAGTAGYGLFLARRPFPPLARRITDIAELALALAVIPLALDVSGLYSLV